MQSKEGTVKQAGEEHFLSLYCWPGRISLWLKQCILQVEGKGTVLSAIPKKAGIPPGQQRQSRERCIYITNFKEFYLGFLELMFVSLILCHFFCCKAGAFSFQQLGVLHSHYWIKHRHSELSTLCNLGY